MRSQLWLGALGTVLAGVFVVTGCSVDPGITEGGAVSGMGASSGSGAGGEGSGTGMGGGGGGFMLMLSNGMGGGGGDNGANLDRPKDPICTKMDVVIAVDNSGSMSEEQKWMSGTIFPKFAEKLKTSIGPGFENFRVGAKDACPTPPQFFTKDQSDNGMSCMFSSGKSWMESTSPRLTQEFMCVGAFKLGDTRGCPKSNVDEQPAAAAAAAIEPPIVTTGANAGFLRNDALLVIVAVTDEDEQPNGQTPKSNEVQAWAKMVYDRIVNTKGNVKQIVFVGIGAPTSCKGPYGSAREAILLKEITRLFSSQQRGVFWDICGGNWEEGLNAAFEIIKQACWELPTVIK